MGATTPRMFCTRCLRTAVADTRLPGSDRIEMGAWCAFALPGFFYCAWRHLERVKVCGHCGSEELVREARAAAARRGDWIEAATRITEAGGRCHWPPALVSPRRRLRCGAPAAGFAVAGIACVVAAAMGGLAPFAGLPLLHACAAACVGALAREWLRAVRGPGASTRCSAWDAGGRPLPLERLG